MSYAAGCRMNLDPAFGAQPDAEAGIAPVPGDQPSYTCMQ